MIKSSLSLIALLAISILHCNQSSAQNGTKIQKRSLEYRIDIANGELQVTETETIDKKVLSLEAAHGYELKESFITDEFTELINFEAHTLVPREGKKPKRIKTQEYTTEDYVSRGIFHSDTKRNIITFPNVAEGSILHSKIKYKRALPELLSPFYYNEYLQCDTAELILIVDNNVKIKFNHYNFENDSQVQFTKTEEQNNTIYRWVSTNNAPRKYEDDSPSISCYSPHTIFRIASYNTNGKNIAVLNQTDDLFNWYSSLVKDQELSKEYHFVLDSLKSVSLDKEALAENIFNWVQHQVKYIAYEDGYGGFVPRTPDAVIKNRYGDCKDMAMLTKTMMNACEIDCYLAWVGTRSKCYSYKTCPTPMVDNHMIAAYPTEDGMVFIDPTSTYLEFLYPSSFIQGKEAMVRLNSEEYKVIEIPFVEAQKNKTHDIIAITLDGEKASGHGTSSFGGYAKIDKEYDLVHSSVNLEELFAEIHTLGNNSFKVSNLTVDNFNSNTGEMLFEYDFNISNCASRYDSKLYFSPILVDVIGLDIAGRELDYEIDHYFENRLDVRVSIDSTIHLTTNIKNVSLNENGFELEIKSETQKDFIEYHIRFTCRREIIHTEEFDSVQKTLRKMNKLLKQQIEFEYAQ